MTKITLAQAQTAFDKAGRTTRSKTMDTMYSRKPKYVLDEDDERGSRFLTKSGTKTYDFVGVDAGQIIRYANKIAKMKELIKVVTDKEKKNVIKGKLKKYKDKLKIKLETRKSEVNESKQTIIKETLDNIKNINGFLYSTRKFNLKTEEQKGYYKQLVRAIDAFDFYPTPPQYAQMIYDDIHKNSSFDVYDIACGLASLSLPFIEDTKKQVESLTMFEYNEDFYKLLKPLDNLKNVNVINNDFFRLDVNMFKKSKEYGRRPLFVCNPPFEGVNRLFLKSKKHKPLTKMFYLDFLFRIIHFGKQLVADIDEFYVYMIMPKTYFDKVNDFSKVPTSVLNRNYELYPELFTDANYDSDEEGRKKSKKDIDLTIDFIYQLDFLGNVDGFRTLRNGKPTELKMSFGLYKFIIM